MARRNKMTKKSSKKLFKRTASKIHKKNALRPMRGGIRF